MQRFPPWATSLGQPPGCQGFPIRQVCGGLDAAHTYISYEEVTDHHQVALVGPALAAIPWPPKSPEVNEEGYSGIRN